MRPVGCVLTSAEYRFTESLNAFRTPQALLQEAVLGEVFEGDGQGPVLNYQLRFELPKTMTVLWRGGLSEISGPCNCR